MHQTRRVECERYTRLDIKSDIAVGVYRVYKTSTASQINHARVDICVVGNVRQQEIKGGLNITSRVHLDSSHRTDDIGGKLRLGMCIRVQPDNAQRNCSKC